MNSRILIMLITALIFAGGAAWMAKRWVDSQPGKSTTANANTTTVIVAAIEIPFGTRIEKIHLKKNNFPKEGIPEGAFTDDKLVIGKITQRKYIANEVLLEPQIKEHLGGSFLSALIPEGMRAITVRVNDVVGVAGFIAPGNKVDIIASRKGGFTHVLLSNVKVLAIGQSSSPEQDKPAVVKSLTLEVTPDQAKKVVAARGTGSLQFTLRNMKDDSNVETEVVETASKEIEIIEYQDPVIEDFPLTTNKPKKIRKPKRPSFKMIPWGQTNTGAFDEG